MQQLQAPAPLLSGGAPVAGGPMKKAENCVACGSDLGLRRFAVSVDGEELRLAPTLCAVHGDLYLLELGKVLGGIVAGSRHELELFKEFS